MVNKIILVLAVAILVTSTYAGGFMLRGRNTKARAIPSAWTFPTAGLTGHWTFDTDEGAYTSDSSGNGHTGTLNVAVWNSTVTQVGAGSIRCNTDGYQVTIATSSLLDTGTKQFSVFMWLKGDNDPIINDFFFSRTSDNFDFTSYFTGVLDFYDGSNYVESNLSFTGTDWNFIGITRSDTVFTLWRNGSSHAVTGSATCNFTGNMVIGGGWNGTVRLHGWIDDASVWNVALSCATVLDIYDHQK